MQKGLLVSEFARIVTQFDDFIISLSAEHESILITVLEHVNEIIKENPNDADLGAEIRRFLRRYE